jgi:hypothetical protein
MAPYATQLVRKSDGKVMASRQTPDWEGWQSEYEQPRIKTTAGVSIPQKTTVIEWTTITKWRFDSRHPQMNLARMWELVVSAHDLEEFTFHDLEGGSYDVVVFATAEPKRDTNIIHFSQYELTLGLLRTGYTP